KSGSRSSIAAGSLYPQSTCTKRCAGAAGDCLDDSCAIRPHLHSGPQQQAPGWATDGVHFVDRESLHSKIVAGPNTPLVAKTTKASNEARTFMRIVSVLPEIEPIEIIS